MREAIAISSTTFRRRRSARSRVFGRTRRPPSDSATFAPPAESCTVLPSDATPTIVPTIPTTQSRICGCHRIAFASAGDT